MRIALVILLVNGLVPALGEAAEAAIHYAVEGHLAHGSADRGDLGDQGCERGCSTAEHRCTCCASQVVVMAASRRAHPPGPMASRHFDTDQRLASLDEPAPPYRPPIAS
jgi:hypothetical protein